MESLLKDGIYIVELYLKLISELLGAATSNNKPIFVESHGGAIYNFQSGDFQIMLKELLPPTEKAGDYLAVFKTLQWIICEEDRFTNVQWIHGTARRVISVDINKYRLLQDLEWKHPFNNK